MTLALVIQHAWALAIGSLVVAIFVIFAASGALSWTLERFGYVVGAIVIVLFAHWLGTQILEVIGG